MNSQQKKKINQSSISSPARKPNTPQDQIHQFYTTPSTTFTKEIQKNHPQFIKNQLRKELNKLTRGINVAGERKNEELPKTTGS